MIFLIKLVPFGSFYPSVFILFSCESPTFSHLRFYLPISFLPPVLFAFTHLPSETKPRKIHDIGVIPQHRLHRQSQVSSSKLTVNISSRRQIVSPMLDSSFTAILYLSAPSFYSASSPHLFRFSLLLTTDALTSLHIHPPISFQPFLFFPV